MQRKHDKPINLLFTSIHSLLDSASGAAKSVRTMLAELQSSGVDCTAFTGSAVDAAISQPTHQLFAELGAEKLPTKIAANLMHVPEDQFRHYVTPQTTTNRRQLSATEETEFSNATVAFLGIAKPDVVMVMGGGIHERALLKRCRSMGIKTLFYLTNPTHTDPLTFENADLIVTDTKATKDYFQKTMDLSLCVVGKFVYEPRTVPELGGTDVLFINPSPEKGVMLVLAIARECARRSLGFRFRIVEGRSQLQHAIDQSGIPSSELGNIDLAAGSLSMHQHYEASKILIMPSLWHESGSRSLLEACAHGLPVIASNRGGNSEILGKGGIVLPIESPLDGRSWMSPDLETVRLWADQVQKLMTEPNYYKARQNAALKRWREYRIRSSTVRMKREIQSLLTASV